jgi:hypothetical protein
MPLPVSIPVQKEFSDATVKEINLYVKRNLDSLIAQWKVLHTQKITSWRRIYRGVPREKYKSFPWKGAANLVPRIVASFVDQLTARLMMGIYGVDPIFPAGLVGSFAEDENADQQREAIEVWMNYAGKSPDELNLFHAEYAWFSNAIKYGFAALKHPWEHIIEQVAEASTGKDVVFRDWVKQDGPVPKPILFEDFLVPLRATDFRTANFKAHRVTLTEFDLLDRKMRGLYPTAKINALLSKPDRMGPDDAQRNMEMDLAAGSTVTDAQKQWDIYECYFPFIVNGKRFSLISSYHLGTQTDLRTVFNFFPNNMDPFKMARLGSDGESILGQGFCELLGVYQEEVAQIHNQRRDSGTLSNTTIIRASSSSQIDTNFSVYPMAVLTGGPDDFTFETIGRATTETIKEEQMTLQLAQDAAGVGPSSSGSGAGTVNKKGSYSSMGSFANQQEGNTRANLHQTNSRYSHLSLGNDLLRLYAHFGIPEKKIAAMGKMAPSLQKALQNVRDGRLIIPIYAATSSINKEIEKQNRMLMLQNLRAHWQMISQLLSQGSNPMTPPEVIKYGWEVATASNALMNSLMRDFNFDDPSRYNPDPGTREKVQDMNSKQQHAQVPQLPQSLAPNANPDAVRQMAQQMPNGMPPPNGMPQ